MHKIKEQFKIGDLVMKKNRTGHKEKIYLVTDAHEIWISFACSSYDSRGKRAYNSADYTRI